MFECQEFIFISHYMAMADAIFAAAMEEAYWFYIVLGYGVKLTQKTHSILRITEKQNLVTVHNLHGSKIIIIVKPSH